MICPKCKRKYEDDMPKCLWCDAPNPNYGAEDTPENETEPEIKPETEPETEPEKGLSHHNSKEPGLKIFWLALLLGFTGLHCTNSGRTLRGALYLVFGGLFYKMVYLFFRHNGITIPAAVCAVAFACSAVIVFLLLKHVWRIPLGE